MAIQIENCAPDMDQIIVTTSDGVISVYRDESDRVHVEVLPKDSTVIAPMILGVAFEED